MILRKVAGVAVLLILASIGVMLIPPYVQNWKLQRYVNGLVDDPATATQPLELIQKEVVGRGEALGLPVHAGDVQVTRPQNSVRIDVLYIVHFDFAGYSVDLHFRPAAGGS
ncbi:MAG: hypothetical protein ABSE86_13500 [Bryobacteraceae bacterium]